MKLVSLFAVHGLAAAASVRSPRSRVLPPREGNIHHARTIGNYDLCQTDCSLAGIPMPDENTFQLPLESFWSEQCPPTVVGPLDDPLATSRVCLTFSGTQLQFTFSPFSGYTIKSASIIWKLKGNGPTATIAGAPSSGGGFGASLPFSDILQVSPATSTLDLLRGMCPNGDRDALAFSFEFAGEVVPVGGGDALPFRQQYPCATRASDRSCAAWDTGYSYIEVAYRCSKCGVADCSTTSASPSTPSSTTESTTTSTTSSPPALKTCAFGTAFGYQNPVGGVPKSFTLNTQSGSGCNRWGWYLTPTLAELQSGLSGPLYVGAGGNDITKAAEVGFWVATANKLGGVTVNYLLNPPYTLAEVHVNLNCLPILRCGPGQYTYKAGAIPNLSTWSNPVPLVYPTCSGGSRAALIVHASVNVVAVTNSCSAPVAS